MSESPDILVTGELQSRLSEWPALTQKRARQRQILGSLHASKICLKKRQIKSDFSCLIPGLIPGLSPKNRDIFFGIPSAVHWALY